MKKILMLATALFVFSFFLLGCNTLNQTSKQIKQIQNQYPAAIEKAQKVSADVDFKTVASAEEAYRAQYDIYTADIGQLKQFSDLPAGLTILEANQNSYKLRLDKNGQTYYYQKQ